jgi:hypothetical protein
MCQNYLEGDFQANRAAHTLHKLKIAKMLFDGGWWSLGQRLWSPARPTQTPTGGVHPSAVTLTPTVPGSAAQKLHYCTTR